MADRYCGEKHGNFSYPCSDDFGQCKDCKIEQLEAENKALKEELKNWKIAHASQLEANQKLKDDELLAVKSIHNIKEKIRAINDDLCDCSSFLL